MSIRARQNLSESLEKLAAQRFLYRRAKGIRNFSLLLVLVIAFLALTGVVIQIEGFSSAITLAVLFTWFFDQLCLQEWEGRTKREAAAIQEDFDCFVLDMPWPSHKRAKRPTGDRVAQLATSANKNLKIAKDLKDWYTPHAIPKSKTLAQVYCQRMNCWWDANIRDRWQTVLIVSFFGFSITAIILAILTGITVAMFVALIASAIKILAWGIAELKAQSAATKNAQRLHHMLDEAGSDSSLTSAQIRCFQDEIFEHRRTSPLVPDWFFWLNRNRQEAKATKAHGHEAAP